MLRPRIQMLFPATVLILLMGLFAKPAAAQVSLRSADIDWQTLTDNQTVHFHMRFRNTTPGPTGPVSGQVRSQMFGVFMPDLNVIKTFDVPAMAPNSFFDVFFDVSLNQLPPGTPHTGGEKPLPVPGTAAPNSVNDFPGCPPDNHWDGNIDIIWGGAGGAGQVNKHVGNLHACSGSGHSYVHMIVGCANTATWTIAGVCAGFNATLVNEDFTPAPAILPAGWTGFICVNIAAAIPAGTTCCFTVNFFCSGQVGTIDLCAIACACQPQPPSCPGAPVGGAQINARIRELFTTPIPQPAGPEQAVTVGLSGAVVPGFVVLKDLATLADTVVGNWSDILQFSANAVGSSSLTMYSGPAEHPFTDADLAPFGLSLSQIFTGHTCYIAETLPFTRYRPANIAGVTGNYAVYSDQDTLQPGAPLSDIGFILDIREPTADPSEQPVVMPTPVPVQPGFLVLLENANKPSEDPTNWSDVVYFRAPTSGGGALQAILISDKEQPGIRGITNADLAAVGLSVVDVLEGNTVYQQEIKPPTVYSPVGPFNQAARYNVYSDKPESKIVLNPINIEWVTLGSTVRFHARFENTDPDVESEEAMGTMMSQKFGAFMPDFGPIGQFTVPPIAPNSFFDVFLEVPLSALPPSAETSSNNKPDARGQAGTQGVRGIEGSCTPADHWDGNIDIQWASATGGGQVNKHVDVMLACVGGGKSYVHMIVGCTGTATWSVSAACPGWNIGLANMDYSPAPAVLPPGWDGWICVQATAVVPPFSVCPIAFTFNCGGATAVVEVSATACKCLQTQPCPGTPINGQPFAVKLVERFYDHPTSGGAEPPVTVTLPGNVVPGVTVVKDDGALADADVRNWSDLVLFRNGTPGTPSTATLISSPFERPFTDADLAQYGLSLTQILGGNTCYVNEKLPATMYAPTDAAGVGARYYIFSDVDTIFPGAPLQGAGFQIVMRENIAPEGQEIINFDLPAPVQPGYLVLLESATVAADDPRNWSDVVVFGHGPLASNVATLISDVEGPAGEHGINDQDLAPLGLTVGDIIEGNTWYMFERGPQVEYLAANPVTGATAQFVIPSDSADVAGVGGGKRSAVATIRGAIPNPTRGVTRIDYELPRSGTAEMAIFDLSGRKIRTLISGAARAGLSSIRWDGRSESGKSMPSGSYFVKLVMDGQVSSRKIVLVR